MVDFGKNDVIFYNLEETNTSIVLQKNLESQKTCDKFTYYQHSKCSQASLPLRLNVAQIVQGREFY